MSQSRNAIGNLINRYKAVLRKNRILNVFGTLTVSSAVLLGGAGLAHAVTGPQDDWNALFNNSLTITGNNAPGNMYTHAEGRDPSELLTIHGDWNIMQDTTVNGRLGLGDPNAPAFVPGHLSVENNKTLTVTGSLAAQGDMRLGAEAVSLTASSKGTLILDGFSKDTSRLDIAGSATIGTDGGVLYASQNGEAGELNLRTGIATIGGNLTIGGSSDNVMVGPITANPHGLGGAGILTVGENAELHMQAGSDVTLGGSGSTALIALPALPGGSATVTSSGYMHLGNVTMGGDAGSGGNAVGGVPAVSGVGGFGGDATMTLSKGSVTVMNSLKAGGTGGDGGAGADGVQVGIGGLGGTGGKGKITVEGSLSITGATTLGADHGSFGSAGIDSPGTPSVPGGIGGFAGFAGYGRIEVKNGGDITLGSSYEANNHLTWPSGIGVLEIAHMVSGQFLSDSYLEVSTGGTLKLRDTQSRDLVQSEYTTLGTVSTVTGLDAGSLISSGSSGTIRMAGGTVEGNDLSASGGLTLGTGSGEVNAHIVTDRFTIGTSTSAKSITIEGGLSLKITGTTGYLLSSDAEAVKLNGGGTLDVGGDIALNGASVTLINAGYNNANQNVGLAGGNNHVITQGRALAGDAPVNIAGGNAITAKTLDTTTKLDGTHVAGGQDVTVTGANSALHLTQDVAQGSVINLGDAGKLLIDAGALKLTGNVTMGNIGVDASNNSTLSSLTGVQQKSAANTITFANNGALHVSGVLGYNGNLKVGGIAANDVFSGKIVAGGISASALHVDGGDVALTGFADTGRNFLHASALVDGGTGTMTLGGVEGQGGTSSATIAVGSTTNGTLVLQQGNFSTGKITVDSASSAIQVGNGADIGTSGSLQADIDVLNGSLVVNSTAADGGLYTIAGTVTLKNAADLTMTAGNLKVNTLNYETSNNLALNNKNLAVGTLNLAAQTVTTGSGTLAVADLNSSGAAAIDVSGGTIDLGAQNIKDLSKMGAGTAGDVIDGYAGSFTINNSTVKTTATATYINDTALTLKNQAGASSATDFNGALQAGALEAKTTAGAVQNVNVSGNSLTLYGTGTSFLNVDTLTVNNLGTVNLGTKDYALGGTSASKVALAGGTLAVKGGMFTFTGDKTLSTSAASDVTIDDGGVLAFTGQAVDTLTHDLTFKVGSGLQSDASATAGTLLFANTDGLNGNNVSLELKKGALIMGGTGTLADLDWVSNTLNKWGVSSPAILAISGRNTIDLSGSTLNVGGDGQNHFGDNSLTVVDVTHFSLTNPALKVDGAATTFGKDTKLIITGKLVDGNQHTILHSDAGFTATDIKDTWSVARDPNRLINITTAFDTSSKDIIASVSVGTPQDKMPGLSSSLGGLMQAMARDPNFGFDPQSSNAGVRFLSRTAHSDYVADGAQAAATAEGAAQLGAVGNVVGTTLGASTSAAVNAGTRMSFTTGNVDASKSTAMHKDADGTLSIDSGLSAGDGLKNGLGLWLMPMYQHNTTWGQESGEFKTGTTSDLLGISVGADYTIMDAFRFGLALNLGTANGTSTGDYNPTDTRSNFWGLALYGGWMKDNFGLSADVGYTSSFSAITQELPQGMGMPNLKADVNSSAWTAGLRGEYKFATSALDIIPHVGVRYTGITTEDFDVESGGETVFNVTQDHQSLWTFPVGVTFSKQMDTASGWSFTPKMDLGIIAATGDVKTKSSSRIPGLNATAEMETQVVDYMSFDGGLGLEMKNESLSFGLNYNIQASEHRTGHGLFGTVRFEF